ncbi:MAG: hydrolase [Bdellovibrionales bacterium]|nr:hydrolase [Bdellovibrionales bacterium]
MRAFLFCIILLFTSHPIATGLPARLYIWNVGQGQWTTYVSSNKCVHFDMGGEFAPKMRIKTMCRERRNFIHLSHADTDHIKFIFWGKKNLNSLCLIQLPREKLSSKKKWLLSSIPKCKEQPTLANELPLPKHLIKPNDLSRVYVLNSKGQDVLIPGDSTAVAEQFWRTSPELKKIKFLILGHHGSKTSTSDNLLRALPNTLLAIASARKKRYGHPHKKVVDRLHKYSLPLLRTEQWGNISIEM